MRVITAIIFISATTAVNAFWDSRIDFFPHEVAKGFYRVLRPTTTTTPGSDRNGLELVDADKLGITLVITRSSMRD